MEETLQPGASVAMIARQHGVNANQVFHWRKLYREGGLEMGPEATQLVPVRIREVGWRRTLSIRQTFGTRPFHLAAGRRGRGIIEPRATVDAMEGIDWRRPIRSSAPSVAA